MKESAADTRKTWMKYTGSLQQLAYVRPILYTEGRSGQMNAWEVKAGDLFFHVMGDKCLDIADLTYKGMNMTFLAKPGLEGRNHYDTNGLEAQRSIMGGLFFTCGFENIGGPCTRDGRDCPMHGRLRTTPAEHRGADTYFDRDDCLIRLTGEMREAELFGENMVLKRTIEASCKTNSILVTDEIENQSFRPEPLMLLYHCNMGYPFLDETCELVLPTLQVTGRDLRSERQKSRWNTMESPIENEPEYVFHHELAQDGQGKAMAMVINHKKETALCLEYDKQNLPCFMEWKSLAAGDYVLGLEPCNFIVCQNAGQGNRQKVHMLNPFETEVNRLQFTVIEGRKAIDLCRNRILSMVVSEGKFSERIGH